MEDRVSSRRVGGVHSDRAMGAKSRRRPKLSHHAVEILHVIAWVLGVVDVLLVAATFILS